MQFAKGRIRPSPGAHATCPCCDKEVIAHCGEVMAWHWAHRSADCDPWSEPESQWHLNWKERLASIGAMTEVVCNNHRADAIIYNPDNPKKGVVIELQNSSISAAEIIEREKFYGNMVWMVNAEDFQDNLIFKPKDNYYTFRWKHPRPSWYSAKKPVLLVDDDTDTCFLIKKIYPHISKGEIAWDEQGYEYECRAKPCAGWGIKLDSQYNELGELAPYLKSLADIQ